MFNSEEFEWSDVTILVAGIVLMNATSVKYTWKRDKSFRYGKGEEPRSIQKGNKSYEGELVVSQQDYKKLGNALGDLSKAKFGIVVSYGDPSKLIPRTTDALDGCEITEAGKEIKSGDGSMNISLPIMFLRLREDI